MLDNLSHDKRVCVMYANFKAQRDGVLESGFLRVFRQRRLHEAGPCATRFSRCWCRASRRQVGAEAGIGVLVRIEKAIDVRGKEFM